ncbi:MAG: DUF4139 domain-containing protein, partial [Candidatus Omnitrophica bacterium]|nr:DUF4139 domain-containing protein [Candidatus Omnitrophota bacterium]
TGAAAAAETPMERKSVEVTVYNNSLAYVRELLNVPVAQGSGVLRLENIPASLIPESARFAPVTKGDKFQLLEQNFQFDLANQTTLLEKYIGKKMKLQVWHEYQDRKEEVEAELLSTDGPIYRVGTEIFVGHPGLKIMPELPEGLSLRPALVWSYENPVSEKKDFELTYLAGGISWNADYVLTLEEKSMTADLSAWVSLDNRSGARYENARLKLIAGNVERAAPKMAPMMMRGMMAMAADGGAEAFQEQTVFEYHQYTLKRPTTLMNNEKKQILFIQGGPAAVEKEYRADSSNAYGQYDSSQKMKTPVGVYLRFKNTKKNGLGMALPAGTIRVFVKTADGSSQFSGENTINHTPKEEEISLKTGEAFDLVVERRQSDYQQISNQMSESEWEITLKNRKESDVTILLAEQLYGNWKILSHSHPYEKKNAFALEFKVPVPAGKEVKVKYRVRQGI